MVDTNRRNSSRPMQTRPLYQCVAADKIFKLFQLEMKNASGLTAISFSFSNEIVRSILINLMINARELLLFYCVQYAPDYIDACIDMTS